MKTISQPPAADNIVAIHDDIPLADTRVIADCVDVEHRSFYRLLVEYKSFIENAFGTVRFQAAPSKAVGGGGDGQRYALLTEDQATFAVTLTRNTERVVRFKAALVKAFSDAKRQLANRSPLLASEPIREMLALIRALQAEGTPPSTAARIASEITTAVFSPPGKKALPPVTPGQQIARDENYILQIIANSRGKGIARSALTRKTQKFNALQRRLYLKDLQESGQIILLPGRPDRFVATPYAPTQYHSPAAA